MTCAEFIKYIKENKLENHEILVDKNEYFSFVMPSCNLTKNLVYYNWWSQKDKTKE